MIDNKIFLNSGGRDLTLPSGDTGVYVDICIEDLRAIIDEYDKEDILRSWVNKKEDKVNHNIRIFVIPKKDKNESTLYPYYLEVAKVIKK
ncbi:MAG: hypothetical protein J5I47_11065 [Vicingus serpentipes]|nr:hypothetical protein [Vicingus serpentipes]